MRRLTRCIPLIALSIFPLTLVAQTHADTSLSVSDRITIVSPYYSVAGSTISRLLLMNRTAAPVSVDISATSADGTDYALGRYAVGGARHLELSLGELFRSAGSAFYEGSIRVDFLGDSNTIQAWTIVTTGRYTFEIPMAPPPATASNTLLSFWDTHLGGPGAVVQYYLQNLGTSAINYNLTAGRTRLDQRLASGSLRPGERQLLALDSSIPRGWLRVVHDGLPGQLTGIGILSRDSAPLLGLPFVTPEEEPKGPVWESVGLPIEGQQQTALANGRLPLDFFNLGDTPATLTIETVEQSSGSVVSRNTLHIGSLEVGTIDLSAAARSRAAPIRFRVRADQTSLLLRATVIDGSGVRSLDFQPLRGVHGGGTYPLLRPEAYESVLRLVNLGSEVTTVVAQFYWDGGTYAYGPVAIQPGGAASIKPAEVAAARRPDMLGRTLEADYQNAVVKWIVHHGTPSVVGRMEVRPLDMAGDRGVFGLNCAGCCYQSPRALITPGVVSFSVGQTPAFQSSVRYDTCNGPMGPYPEPPETKTVPTPFTWDSQKVGASSGADKSLSFTTHDLKVYPGTCTQYLMPLTGAGSAKTCQKTHNPLNYDPLKECYKQTSSCEACYGCCSAIYNQNVCQGADPAYALPEKQACEGHCLSDRCT